jgi:hypothetical protein
MFGTSPGKEDEVAVNDGPAINDSRGPAPAAPMNDAAVGGVSGNGLDRKTSDASSPGVEKKRRSSGVSRARDMFSSAKQSLHLSSSGSSPAPSAGAGEGNQTQHSVFPRAPSTTLPANLYLGRGRRSESVSRKTRTRNADGQWRTHMHISTTS